MTSLTEQAQQLLSEKLQTGDYVVDATAGNGHDTLFLAKQVGTEGMVYAFDIQQHAISNTQQLLFENNLPHRVRLFQNSHEHLLKYIPEALHQNISAVMFNLGYLPGSDKNCITTTETTLTALKQSMQLLKPGGLLSIMLYPGHPGGKEEAQAVLQWAGQLPATCRLHHVVTKGPQWLLLQPAPL